MRPLSYQGLRGNSNFEEAVALCKETVANPLNKWRSGGEIIKGTMNELYSKFIFAFYRLD